MAKRKRDRDEGGGIHFTVGTVAGHDSAEGLDLRRDLALVKASLLYADSVKLCSPGSSILSGIAEFQEARTEEQAKLVVKFLPDLQPSFTPEEIYFFEAVVEMRSREEKRRIKKKTRQKILAMVADKQHDLEEMVVGQHHAAGIEGFREAVHSGLLKVHPYRETSAEALVAATIRGDGNPLRGFNLADLLLELIDEAMGAVKDATTYPLFDDLTGDFISEAVRHDLLSPTEAGFMRGRYGALCGDLLRRLPLFERASLSDVLAVRRELEAPLQGFRIAVSGFSHEVNSAGWEPEFSEEADALFREKVEPEVEIIEEAVNENASLKELAYRTARQGATPATFGALIGSASDRPTLAGAAGVKAMLDRRDKLREIRDNQLYFYYRADEKLQSSLG